MKQIFSLVLCFIFLTIFYTIGFAEDPKTVKVHNINKDATIAFVPDSTVFENIQVKDIEAYLNKNKASIIGTAFQDMLIFQDTYIVYTYKKQQFRLKLNYYNDVVKLIMDKYLDLPSKETIKNTCFKSNLYFDFDSDNNNKLVFKIDNNTSSSIPK